jgi:hypothetical protein
VLGLIALAGIIVALLQMLLRPADAARGRTLRLVLAAELTAIAVSALFYAALFEDPIFWVAAALVALSAAPARQANAIATPASG